MKRKVRILVLGYAIMLSVFLIAPVVAQGWPQPPVCGSEQLYNRDFALGTEPHNALGWLWDTPWLIDIFRPEYEADDPKFMRMNVGHGLGQELTLPAGHYVVAAGMILRQNSDVCPCNLPDFANPLLGDCEAIDPSEWEGEHWGQIRVFWNGTLIFEDNIPNGLSHETYYQFSYPVSLAAGTGYFKFQLWSPAFCCYMHVAATEIDLDWTSLCRVPDPTVTPTVTGTPPSTGTPTTTPTVYCESTDYPTHTPYPTSTAYPTNTPWGTPPMFFTDTPAPTYTPYNTCVPTATKTPYASATPFRFGVPITYTNNFDDLRDGMQEFFDSTEGLIGDVGGILISASVAMSDVTSFGITNTVVISGTPVTTTSMVETFVSNMDSLRYVFGWFGVMNTIAPTPFWFLLLCIVWTIFVYAFKFASTFFADVLWPLARTLWDIIIDVWNAIPFI